MLPRALCIRRCAPLRSFATMPPPPSRVLVSDASRLQLSQMFGGDLSPPVFPSPSPVAALLSAAAAQARKASTAKTGGAAVLKSSRGVFIAVNDEVLRAESRAHPPLLYWDMESTAAAARACSATGFGAPSLVIALARNLRWLASRGDHKRQPKLMAAAACALSECARDALSHHRRLAAAVTWDKAAGGSWPPSGKSTKGAYQRPECRADARDNDDADADDSGRLRARDEVAITLSEMEDAAQAAEAASRQSVGKAPAVVFAALSAPEIIDTLCAFSMVGIRAPAMYRAASVELMAHFQVAHDPRLEQPAYGARRGSSHVTPASAVLSVPAGQLPQGMLAGCSTLELTRLLHAFASSLSPAPVLIAAVAGEMTVRLQRECAVTKRSDSLTPSMAALSAHALATLGHSSNALFTALADAAADRGLGCFSVEELATLAWSFAALGLHDSRLYAAVSAHPCLRSLATAAKIPSTSCAMLNSAFLAASLEMRRHEGLGATEPVATVQGTVDTSAMLPHPAVCSALRSRAALRTKSFNERYRGRSLSQYHVEVRVCGREAVVWC